jgi:hypothetical protein
MTHLALRLIRPLLNITKLVSIPGMEDLIILHGGSLSRLSIAGLLASNNRSSLLEQTSVEVSDPGDGQVFAVCGGMVQSRSVGEYWVSARYFRELTICDQKWRLRQSTLSGNGCTYTCTIRRLSS